MKTALGKNKLGATSYGQPSSWSSGGTSAPPATTAPDSGNKSIGTALGYLAGVATGIVVAVVATQLAKPAARRSSSAA